jgi:methyl-accepting chemotaxis protein
MAFNGIVPTICFAGALWWVHSSIRTWAYESKYEAIQQLVQAAWNSVDYYAAQARDGKITVEQAQQAAKNAVRHLRYGHTEGAYFWINDLQPRMVMNTARPELEGKDLSDRKDPNGIHVFQEMVKVCRESGEGRLLYMWPRTDTQVIAPKINYVKLYQPWNWVIGTGIYVDESNAKCGS